MDTLYSRIKKRREELDMSQAELAELLGYSDRSTIAKIEKGVNDISQSKIVAFAEKLHTTPAYLMGWTDDYYDYDLDEDNRTEEIPIAIHEALMEQYNGDLEQVWHEWLRMQDEAVRESSIFNHPCIQPLPRMRQWKVLGGTACGEPIFKELDDETVLAPADIDADFVFRCVGDSMINARIFDGDIVFVKSGPVEDGQIAVVRVEDSYSLKRIYHGPDYLELRSENPMYPPIIIRGEQTNAEIVGRAVQFLSRVI